MHKMTGAHFAAVAQAVHRTHTARLTDISNSENRGYNTAMEAEAYHDELVRNLANALEPLAGNGAQGFSNFDRERFVAQCNGAPVAKPKAR